jgi:hypothetical protein
MNESEKHRGGKRPGSGRKSLGKKRYNLTLTAANVEAARKREPNLSGLLDDLLARYLRKK